MSRFRTARVTLLVMVASLAPAVASDPNALLSQEFPARTVRVRVLEAGTKAPIAGAKLTGDFLTRAAILAARPNAPIEPRNICAPANPEKFNLETDADGYARLQLPAGPVDTANMRVEKDGWVAARIRWWCEEGQTSIPLPAEYEVSLAPATTIGGIVRDVRGAPVPEVKLQLTRRYSRDARSHIGEPEGRVSAELHTDAEGRWSFSGGPDSPPALYDMQILFIHPKFSPWDVDRRCTKVDWDALKAKTWVFVLKDDHIARGTVRGRVLKPDGSPAVGATVWSGRAPRGMPANSAATRMDERRETTTDADGRFVFEDASPSQSQMFHDGMQPPTTMTVNVRLAGFVQATTELPLQTDAPETVIKLSAARSVRLRFVDSAGAPLVDVHTQKPAGEFENPLMPGPKSDADGWVEFRDVPNAKLNTLVSKSGYMDRWLTDSEIRGGTVTLRPVIRVSGKVADEKTGNPVSVFTTFTVSRDLREGEPNWSNAARYAGKDGALSASFSDEGAEYWLRIDAEGYLGQTVRIDPQSPKVELKLTPLDMERRRIVTPDGAPAAGARWTVVSNDGHRSPDITFTDGRPNPPQGGVEFKTYEEFPGFEQTADTGGFVQPKLKRENDTAYVWHETGWDVLSGEALRSKDDIRLRSWCGITGTLLRDGKPAVDAEVWVHSRLTRQGSSPLANLREQLSTRTDANGRFSFPRVLAGHASVGPAGDPNPAFRAMRYEVSVVLKDGESRNITLGEAGRDIVARVPPFADVLPQAPADARLPLTCVLTTSPPRPPPEVVEASDDDAYRRWYEESDEARAWKSRPKSFRASPDVAGMVRFNDVPAGRYTLHATYSAPPTQEARIEHEFEVPASPERGPLDLGQMTARVPVRLAAGTPAPELEVTLRDGTKLTLSSLSGKTVLVAFWASWSRSALRSCDELRDLAARFAADDRLVIVSVSADEDFARWERTLDKHNYVGRHGILSSEQRKQTLERWGVPAGGRSVFVIGQDGRLLTGSDHLLRCEQIIRSALNQMPAAAKQ